MGSSDKSYKRKAEARLFESPMVLQDVRNGIWSYLKHHQQTPNLTKKTITRRSSVVEWVPATSLGRKAPSLGNSNPQWCHVTLEKDPVLNLKIPSENDPFDD